MHLIVFYFSMDSEANAVLASGLEHDMDKKDTWQEIICIEIKRYIIQFDASRSSNDERHTISDKQAS